MTWHLWHFGKLGMIETYQPADVGKMLGVDASTIRRWSAAHRAHLSPTANPPPGGKRALTFRDVEVLRTIQTLKNQGLSIANIDAKLANLTFASLAEGESSEGQQTAQNGPGEVIERIVGNDAIVLPTTIIEALTALPTQLAAHDQRIDALESHKLKQQLRIEFLEEQRTKVDVMFLVVAGFIAGLIAGLAVWWFQ